MDDVTKMILDRLTEMDDRIDVRFGRVEDRIAQALRLPVECVKHTSQIEGLIQRQSILEAKFDKIESKMELVATASGRQYSIMGGIAALASALTLAVQWAFKMGADK